MGVGHICKFTPYLAVMLIGDLQCSMFANKLSD